MPKLDYVKNFLNHYMDEESIEGVALGKIAVIDRKEILKIKSENDFVKIDFVNCNEETEASGDIEFKNIKITSDLTIWTD